MDAPEITGRILRRLSHIVLAGLPFNAILEFTGTPPWEVFTAVLHGTVIATVLTLVLTAVMILAGRRFRFSVRDLWGVLLAGAVIGSAVTTPETILLLTWTTITAFVLLLASHTVPAVIARVADHRST